MAATTYKFRKISLSRALAAWVGVWLLLWQTAFASGLIERPMAPMQDAGGALVICTEHGAQTLPGDGTPARAPGDHSGMDCPCCLPFMAGHGGAILPVSVILAAPDWTGLRLDNPRTVLATPRESVSGPQQPRAPPVSI